MKRKVTQFKLRVIPFLKTLDLSFFMRLAFFGSLLYGVSRMLS